VKLIGLPLLRADADGMLYLAWAEPGDTAASLRLVSKHP
jgi:hypothetical protein